MSSSCWIFVYKGVTSAVTKGVLNRRGGSFSIRLRKYFVSLMCDERLLASSWMKWVMQTRRWSVGLLHPETIERSGQSGL